MNKKFNRLASLLLAVSMVFSAVPAFATSTETGKDIIVDENNQGGKGSVPVTLNVGTAGAEGNAVLQFSVTVPTSLPVHVDGAGVVTVANNAEIVNRSSGPVEVKSIGIKSQNDWLLADWTENLATEKVGTKKYALAIQGPKTTTDTAVTRVDDNNGTGDTSTFVQIAGKGDAANNTKPFTYNAHIAPQSTAVSATIANVVFTIGWDEANVKGVDATVDKDNVTTPPQEEDEPEPIIYNDDGSITAKVGSVIPLGGFAYYSDEIPAIGWKSSNEDLATVDEDGNVTILDGSSGYEGANDDAYKVSITCYFKDAEGNENSTMESNNVVFHVWKGIFKPFEASIDWEYTVDSTTKTITLNKYIGNSLNVEVHNKYLVNGILYENVALGESGMYSAQGPFFGSNKRADIISINFDNGIILPNNMINMFINCQSLVNIKGLEHFDTSKVTVMNQLFGGCINLCNLNGVSGWNTSSVQGMSSMFSGCSKITDLDLSNWNMSSVTNISSMFRGCTKLSEIKGLSQWNCSNVTKMDGLFHGCTSLKDFNEISNWQTLNVKDMSSMFFQCYNFNAAIIENWNVSSVTNMNNMFSYCSGIHNLNLSKWNINSNCTVKNMLSYCSSLSKVYVKTTLVKTAIEQGGNVPVSCQIIVGTPT